MKFSKIFILKTTISFHQFALPSLERALVTYMKGDSETPFDARTVPSAPPPSDEKPANIMEAQPSRWVAEEHKRISVCRVN